MCEHCHKIAKKYDISHDTVHEIISEFVKLQQADGVFSLQVHPGLIEEWFGDDELS